MRTMVAALAMTVIAAGAAQAQYKQTQPSTQTAPTVQVGGGSAVQMVPTQPATDTSLESARRITRDEAVKMVKSGKAVWIDVRSKEQYDLSHIPNAISIPLSELPNRWKDLAPYYGKFLITYCA
jgi:hypothetical protein